jgi:hypothetical protein
VRRASLLALLLIVPAASAATQDIDLEVRDDGFHLANVEEANPVLRVEPGTHVIAHLRNVAATPQNLHFGAPVNASTPYAQRPGESADVAFDLPADFRGDVPYYSDTDPTRHAGILRVGKIEPSVRIVGLGNDADVGESFEVRIVVDHFTLDPFGSTTNVEGHGHVVWTLDGKNVTGLTDKTSHTFAGLTRGAHLVGVQLAQHDGTPLDPPASDQRVVYRGRDVATPPSEPPATSAPTKPTPGAPLALALALALALTASPFRRRR